MKKDSFYKFIIYKIFTSEYKDMFILDGSYGLYLTVESKNKRILGDLDLNDLSVFKWEGIKSADDLKEHHWVELLSIFKKIFEPLNIGVDYDYHLNDVRMYNTNSVGSKLIFTINGNDIYIDLSLIINDAGSTKEIWNLTKEDKFRTDFGLYNNVNEVTIKRFEDEKFLANKILSIVKTTNTFRNDNANISKSLYDIWFIVRGYKDFDGEKLNVKKLKSQLSLMYNEFQGLKKLLDGLYRYIDTNIIRITKNMSDYITIYSLNKELLGSDVIQEIMKSIIYITEEN